eukprot:356194-Chlamydomonas_euryale.AAC.1
MRTYPSHSSPGPCCQPALQTAGLLRSCAYFCKVKHGSKLKLQTLQFGYPDHDQPAWACVVGFPNEHFDRALGPDDQAMSRVELLDHGKPSSAHIVLCARNGAHWRPVSMQQSVPLRPLVWLCRDGACGCGWGGGLRFPRSRTASDRELAPAAAGASRSLPRHACTTAAPADRTAMGPALRAERGSGGAAALAVEPPGALLRFWHTWSTSARSGCEVVVSNVCERLGGMVWRRPPRPWASLQGKV